MPARVRLLVCVLGVGAALVGCASDDPRFASPPRAHELSVAIPESSRAALERAPFAMLVWPPRYLAATVATSGTVAPGRGWAALSVRHGELTLSLHGSNVEHDALSEEDLAALPPATHTVRGAAARVTVNEGIRVLTWVERGIALSLEIECFHPEDPRCVGPELALELAESLEVYRPRGAR